MRLMAALAALGLLATGAVAQAGDLEFYTGDNLYAQCVVRPAAPDRLEREARCAGYILGVSDAHQAAQGAGAVQRTCLPATATSPQLVADVTRYLEDHPGKRPLAAQDLVNEALAASYPCR